jgi:hypothetical protein
MTGGMGFQACSAQQQSEAGDVRFGPRTDIPTTRAMSALPQLADIRLAWAMFDVMPSAAPIFSAIRRA